MLYFVITGICLKRDLSTFVTLASYGAISIMIISAIVIMMGILSFTNTNFSILNSPNSHNLSVEPSNVDFEQELK